MRPAVLPFLSLAFALALAPCSPSHAADGKGGARLFKLGDKVEHDGLLRFRPLAIDVDALDDALVPGGRMVVPDPDGGELVYDYVSHIEHEDGITTWVGRHEGALPGFEAIFTFGGTAVFGQAPRPDGTHLYLETVGGKPRLMEDLALDIGQRSDVQVDDAVIPDAASLLQAQKDYAAGPGAMGTQSTPGQVDILLAYTPGLAAYIGSDLSTRVLLQNRIDLGNQALANAGVAGSFRLVATPRVDYPDTGSNSNTLSQMYGWTSSRAAQRSVQIHPLGLQLAVLRHRYGADLVGLVRRYLNSESGSCGVGFVGGGGGGNIASSIDYGYFNASHGTDSGFFCRNTTIAHEIGHNLGQTHDIETTGGSRTGTHTYSHGYRVTPAGQNGFFTVMAYGTGSQQSAITFSTPLVTSSSCSNQACGLADADVARSLNQTMPVVSQWFAPMEGNSRVIIGTRGHLEMTFSGLPALTDARYRVTYAGSGSFTVTGPTRAAPGATARVRLGWSGLPVSNSTPTNVTVVVESAPGVVVATRNLQLTRRDFQPSPVTLGDNRPVTMAVARFSSSRDHNESRLQFVLPPHANSARVRVVSTQDVDIYAAPAAPREIATSALLGAGLNSSAATVSDTGAGLTKEIIINRSAGAVGAERWQIALGRPSSASLSYVDATVTARIETQSAAPAFRSGQYYNPQRSGHGLFLDFAGDQWISVWYTYLDDGTPTWYYSQAAAPGPSGVWSAPLFRLGWNGSFGTGTEVGDLVVTPVSATEMEFSYNLDGEAGSEPMVRLGGATGCPLLQGQPLDATGHWYSPSLPGFGYSAQFEVDQEIYVSYLYDGQGVPRWLTGNKAWPDPAGTLPLFQLTGFCPTCGHMPVVPVTVGQLTRAFGTVNDGARGLSQIGVNATLAVPLSGTWNESRGTAILAARKNCN